MLCQKCHQHEADRFYVGQWNGSLFMAAFCGECMEDLSHKAEFTGHAEMFRQMTGWFPGKPSPRADGESSFPAQAGEGLCAVRRLNALKYQLEEAASREDYQKAAQLRDTISRLQEEARRHEP